LNFLQSTKEKFSSELKDYNELNQKLRTSKNIDGEIKEIINKADQYGILPNTFKQQENFLRKKREGINNIENEVSSVNENKSVNKDLPWAPNDNFVVMNL